MSTTGSAGENRSHLSKSRWGYVIANATEGLARVVRPPRPSLGRRAFRAAWRRLLVPGAMSVVVVALSMLFLDQAAYDAVARLPVGVIDTFNEITDFGRSSWLLVPAGGVLIALAFLASPALDHISRAVLAAVAVRAGYVFLGIGVPGLTVSIVKRWIGRVRPSAAGPFAYEWFSWRPDYASLPSGHSTAVFAAVVAIGSLWPRTRPILWAYALLIALSRVIVSAHYSSDVIAGAVCGAFGAVVVREWFAVRRLAFYVGSDGSVRPLPGPSWTRLKKVARTLFAQ